MNENTTINNNISKIVDEASNLPIECQEYVLGIMRAMAFTRNIIIQKETN